jgi:hypothetical protein
MESNNSLKLVTKPCGVCGGMGGWKISADWWENNWFDCPYCGGHGFYDEEEDEQQTSHLLTYNSYKKKITDILDSFGQLISYSTSDQGKNIEISLVPSNKDFFLQFIKAILKFGYINKRLSIAVNQVLYYEPHDGLYHYYWKIILVPDSIEDLDGLIDTLKAWEEKLNSARGRTGR